MMHLRFRPSPHHPNAALVAALSELSDYEELLGESFRADAFAKAAAALKATPDEVTSSAQLDALELPFLGSTSSIRKEHIPEFLSTGSMARLRAHREAPGRAAALHLSRLPYVTRQAALAWAAAGHRTPADVWAAHTAGSLVPPLASAWLRMAMQHGDELRLPLSAADRAPLLAEVSAAAAAFPGGGLILEATGGVARGREVSHDLDILLTHLSREGGERGALEAIVRALSASPAVARDAGGSPVLLASLARSHGAVAAASAAAATDGSSAARANKAMLLIKLVGQPLRHIDILAVPRSELAACRLGWAGSQLFVRMLHLHARNSLGLKLSNSALSGTDDSFVVARDGRRVPRGHIGTEYVQAEMFPRDELELFRLLRLPWRPASDRDA